MKKKTLGLLVVLSLFSVSPLYAVTIGFDPLFQEVLVGAPAVFELFIKDLGDFTAPSLGGFDLDILFDPAILAFDSVTYGDPVLGDQLDLFGLGFPIISTTPGVATVNLFELSFNTVLELNDFQAGSFTLATLTFDTLTVGTSPLGILINSLSDAEGYGLSAVTEGGSITATPEPGTVLLLGFGLAWLPVFRKLANTRASEVAL